MGEKGAAEEEGAAGLPLPLGSAAPVAPGLPVQRPAVPGLQAPCWLPPGTPSHLQGSPARAAAACRTGRGRRGHVQASVLWLGDHRHLVHAPCLHPGEHHVSRARPPAPGEPQRGRRDASGSRGEGGDQEHPLARTPALALLAPRSPCSVSVL